MCLFILSTLSSILGTVHILPLLEENGDLFVKKPQVINVRALKVEFSLLHEIVHFSIEFLGSPGSFCCTHESFHSFEDFGKSCKIK